MKQTLILFVFAIMGVILFSSVPNSAYSSGAAGLTDKEAIGTIKVCWGPICTTGPQTTIVNLVDAGGNTLGTCTITPPSSCCKIQGNFPTGTYYFVYYRPIGATDCRTNTFNYVNGTDVELDVICACP